MPASKRIVIASVARTPIAKFCGSFSSLKASELGAVAIRGALNNLRTTAGDNPNNAAKISESIFGNVVSAGMGQAPCRQAVLYSGLPESTVCTTINKVCASGMKSVMMGAQALAFSNSASTSAGSAILAGGMESMSNIPHYFMNSRKGTMLGDSKLVDGVIHDGLWDLYNNQHMGMCAEKCANDYAISREEQDEFTKETYQRAHKAVESGVFTEVVPVSIPQRRGDDVVIDKDEEPATMNIEKLSSLKPAFDRKMGTVTAANASSLNDGACALVLMTEDDAKEFGVVPLARILGFGDAAQNPVDFTTTPSMAVPVALANAGIEASDVDFHEINEAFAVVALANMKLMGLDYSNVNVFGGAVALGHPIGMSGARIIGTLIDVLRERNGTIGCASICNGGGGASAIVIERMV